MIWDPTVFYLSKSLPHKLSGFNWIQIVISPAILPHPNHLLSPSTSSPQPQHLPNCLLSQATFSPDRPPLPHDLFHPTFYFLQPPTLPDHLLSPTTSSPKPPLLPNHHPSPQPPIRHTSLYFPMTFSVFWKCVTSFMFETYFHIFDKGSNQVDW